MISHVTRQFRLSRALSFLVLASFQSVPIVLQAQTAPHSVDSLLPGPKPSDVSLEWKQIVGIYKAGKETIVVSERNGRLYYAVSGAIELQLKSYEAGKYSISSKEGDRQPVRFERSANGQVATLFLNKDEMTRSDAGSDPAHFYHVSPL